MSDGMIWRAAAGALLLAASAQSLAQPPWAPERAVDIIVNTAAGSGPDRMARTLQKIWQEQKLVPTAVTVSNRPGGGGAIAYNFLNQKGADGHFSAIASASLISNNVMGRGPGPSDITPIARLSGEYIAVAVRADSPLKSGREMMEILRKDPGALSIGVATSLGNSNHQAVALALKASGIDVRKAKNVVFQSGGNAITALLGGHVDVVPASVSSWVSRLKAGEVRLLAVAAPQRLTGEIAQVPTWREQGVNAVVSNWRSLIGPREMTASQVAYWEAVTRKATATEEWKQELERGHLTDEFLASAGFRKYLEEQQAQIRALLVDLELVK
jgi:putative tricarboxylic transport membrane protein